MKSTNQLEEIRALIGNQVSTSSVLNGRTPVYKIKKYGEDIILDLDPEYPGFVDDFFMTYTTSGGRRIVNGLHYFPFYRCYVNGIDIEGREANTTSISLGLPAGVITNPVTIDPYIDYITFTAPYAEYVASFPTMIWYDDGQTADCFKIRGV